MNMVIQIGETQEKWEDNIMVHLLEVECENIFSPKTMAALKGKSGESLRQMLGNKDLMQTLRHSQAILQKIIEAESDFHTELNLIAEIIVKEAYPIIDYANIKIDAKIAGPEDINVEIEPDEEDPLQPSFGQDNEEKLKAKRRIINGITQGIKESEAKIDEIIAKIPSEKQQYYVGKAYEESLKATKEDRKSVV